MSVPPMPLRAQISLGWGGVEPERARAVEEAILGVLGRLLVLPTTKTPGSPCRVARGVRKVDQAA
jgi:hypothetical protein